MVHHGAKGVIAEHEFDFVLVTDPVKEMRGQQTGYLRDDHEARVDEG